VVAPGLIVVAPKEGELTGRDAGFSKESIL
jgi:hypothetical protein